MPEPVELSPNVQAYDTIPASSVDVEMKLHDIREQSAVNDGTGAWFVGVVGGGGCTGGGTGSVTVPPDPFTRNILLGEEPAMDPSAPVVAFDTIA